MAFLVLDDAQLAIPIEGYKLDVILGFPVFRAMQRVRFYATQFQPFAPRFVGAHVTPIHFDGSSLFVAALVNGRAADVQLDSGAPATILTSVFAARNADLIDHLERRASRSVSVGGASERSEGVLANAVVKIGECVANLPKLVIELGATSQGPDGSLGQDALERFSSHTIDFKHSRLELEGPTC